MKETESGYYHYYWTCPYYLDDRQGQVSCEGGVIRLPGGRSEREYLMTYCSSPEGWRRCTIARAISRHYEQKEP